MSKRAKPVPRSSRVQALTDKTRATTLRRDKDDVKNVSVTLMDMDSAIMYYFENVIKPSVQENGESIKVPTMYASAERWYNIRSKGFLNDNKGQKILPLIVFRRTSIEKDDTYAIDKFDPESPKLHYSFKKGYTQNQRYDRFSVQQGLMPQNEYYNVAVPDYVNLSYDFIIWTTYIQQMNSIVEKIQYSEGAYWGEPGKMRFRTSIDAFNDVTETDAERLIKTEFSVTLKGYLIPEQFNELVTTNKYLTPRRLVIKDETDINISSMVNIDDRVQEVRVTQGRGGISTVTLANSLNIEGGTGVTVSGNSFDGSSAGLFSLSIGQDVATTSNVTFANMSASSAIHVGNNSFSIFENPGGGAQIDTDLHVKGDLIAENLIISSSITQVTQSFSSGSTIFGNSLDDTHKFSGSMDITGSLTLNGTAVGTSVSTFDTYIRKSFVKKSNSVNPAQATFTAVTASAPSGLTSTSEDDFVFFINGQYMEHDALTISQVDSTFQLNVDTGSIGYALESDDEIIAMGKFDS